MLVSALVPILSFALLSFQQVTRQLERDATARLEQDAKQLGMAVLERLLILEASLAVYEPLETAAELPAFFHERFRRIELRELGAARRGRRGAPRRGRHAAARRSPTRRRTSRCSAASPASRSGSWPRSSRASCSCRRPSARASTSRSARRACRSSSRPAPHPTRRSAPASGSCSCARSSAAPTWTIELAEPQAALLAPLERFRTVFPLVTLLSLLAVGLATLVLVRRSLVPIEQLQIATRRLAARDFSTRVGLATGDEFEELADSFDAMAANIEHHVSVVETVSSVGRALSVEQDAERLLATILRGTMSVTDARAGALSLCDPEDRLVRHLLLEWDAGDEEERPRRLQSLAEDTALAGRTLHEPERGDLSIPHAKPRGPRDRRAPAAAARRLSGREPRAGRVARVADRRRAHEASPRRRVPRAVRGPDPADREGDRPEVAVHRRALPPRPDPHRADRRRRLRLARRRAEAVHALRGGALRAAHRGAAPRLRQGDDAGARAGQVEQARDALRPHRAGGRALRDRAARARAGAR